MSNSRCFRRYISVPVMIAIIGLAVSVWAADSEPSLTITPDHPDHLYHLGEQVQYAIALGGKKAGGELAASYRLSNDGERTLDRGSLTMRAGKASFSASFDQPGFLRLEVELIDGADTLKTACGCGFDVEAIRPTNVLPDDFARFWSQAKAELLRVPVDARLEPADFGNAPGKHYRISLGNIEGARVMGKLIVPDGDGPFPAALWVPYAGVYQVGSQSVYADSGFVVLAIDAHGIAQDKPREWYRQLARGPLDDYRTFGYDDPYEFYFRRVILGAMRAIDYLYTRSDVDTTRLAIVGGSQGGALSLLVAGLDHRVKALAAAVPAMCDHTGLLYGRPSGWPQLLEHCDREKALPTTRYYDAALIAGMIEVPARIGVGFIDNACPPTTVYAAYNNLRGEKVIDNFVELGHNTTKGWVEMTIGWLKKKLMVQDMR